MSKRLDPMLLCFNSAPVVSRILCSRQRNVKNQSVATLDLSTNAKTKVQRFLCLTFSSDNAPSSKRWDGWFIQFP